uniref:Uncharacterized protein n=1 Tax=Ciona savignyi TaxID=51511 RepID=H2YUQ3_CIOSA
MLGLQGLNAKATKACATKSAACSRQLYGLRIIRVTPTPRLTPTLGLTPTLPVIGPVYYRFITRTPIPLFNTTYDSLY